MRKISQKDLGNVRVKNRPNAPVEKKAAPKKTREVPMASMRASMEHYDKQAEATRKVMAHNSAVMEKFTEELTKMGDKVDKAGRKVPYSVDIEREDDDARRMKRLILTPMEA